VIITRQTYNQTNACIHRCIPFRLWAKLYSKIQFIKSVMVKKISIIYVISFITDQLIVVGENTIVSTLNVAVKQLIT